MNEGNRLYIDAVAFLGDRGSLVLLNPSFLISYNDRISYSIHGKFKRFVIEYLRYQEFVSTADLTPHVLFQENRGLSRVSSVNLIYEII